MANVVFYIRIKFIKIEEKKKVVNIVKNRNIKYRNIFKNYCKENPTFLGNVKILAKSVENAEFTLIVYPC